MFIPKMRQTWILIKISILFIIGTTIMFFILDSRYWWFGCARKAFLSTISFIIKVFSSNKTKLDPHNNLYYFLLSILGYTTLMFRFARKAFLSTIFLIIKDHPSNETNLDTHNNLHSFSYWHCNHVLHIRIHDIDTLVLQEKLSFAPFSM